MNLAYFDCFSGISGDMVLGALVDAGVELRELEAELRKLNLDGWKISAERVQRQAIRARKIVHRLGEAEAKVHNIPVEKVHFHEVGAVDSIIDIVGAAIGFELLGIDSFACSMMDMGSGRVQTEHGLLPVPAPGTAELLRDAPTFSSGIEKELVTPTGAAIATTLSTRYAEMPAMKLKAIGYGAGSADLPQQPNVLRLMIGEMAGEMIGEFMEQSAAARWDAPIAVIEANLDDMSPQIYGYFAERALAAGALDIFSTAVQMKKNRPGQLVTVLCEPSNRDRLINLFFCETTTIGIRTYEARRQTLARESVAVETPLGTIRMKVSRRNGTILNAAPEYEDCQRIAAQHGVPLKQVLSTANFHFQKSGEPAK